jgi:hypothetical protein
MFHQVNVVGGYRVVGRVAPSALPDLGEPTKAMLSIPAETTENYFFDGSGTQFAGYDRAENVVSVKAKALLVLFFRTNVAVGAGHRFTPLNVRIA